MDNIFCDICSKKIDGDVLGSRGNYLCEKCFEKPNRNQLMSKRKRDFYADRRDWNIKAKEYNHRAGSKYEIKPRVTSPEAPQARPDAKWHHVS